MMTLHRKNLLKRQKHRKILSEMNVHEEGADETRSGGNDKFELLKTEGQPGWMEKLLKKVPLY